MYTEKEALNKVEGKTHKMSGFENVLICEFARERKGESRFSLRRKYLKNCLEELQIVRF